MAATTRQRLVKRSFQLKPEQDQWLRTYAIERGFASETEALRDILRERIVAEQAPAAQNDVLASFRVAPTADAVSETRSE